MTEMTFILIALLIGLLGHYVYERGWGYVQRLNTSDLVFRILCVSGYFATDVWWIRFGSIGIRGDKEYDKVKGKSFYQYKEWYIHILS